MMGREPVPPNPAVIAENRKAVTRAQHPEPEPSSNLLTFLSWRHISSVTNVDPAWHGAGRILVKRILRQDTCAQGPNCLATQQSLIFLLTGRDIT